MRWVCALVLCPWLASAAVTAADLARDIRETSLDAAECYRVRELSLPKDEARLFFTSIVHIRVTSINCSKLKLKLGTPITATFRLLEE